MAVNSIKIYYSIQLDLISVVTRARSFEIAHPCSTSVDEDTTVQGERNVSPLAAQTGCCLSRVKLPW